jgi:hypothetical protein
MLTGPLEGIFSRLSDDSYDPTAGRCPRENAARALTA